MPHTNPVSSFRVLVIEDSAEMRFRLRSLIEECSPAMVVSESTSTGQVLEFLQKVDPHAVVMNMNQVDGAGGLLLADIKRSRPACVVIVLTNFIFADYKDLCLRLGADYFFNQAQEFERVPEVLLALSTFWDQQAEGASRA